MTLDVIVRAPAKGVLGIIPREVWVFGPQGDVFSGDRVGNGDGI